MQHLIFPESRAVGRRAGVSRRGGPVVRGALLAILGLLVGPRAWAIDITSCPFKISTSGDYHVTQNLACSSTTKPAITVNASNVTLSLDGHTITGPGRTQFQAVAIDVAGKSGVSVSNGTIASFGVAVELEDGTTGSSVSGLTVKDCDDGVSLDFGASGNTVSGNTITSGDVGIAIGAPNNTITNNTANGNETGISINDDTAHGNVVEGNTALGNSSVDLEDVNATCDSNTWMGNCFGTKSQDCIGTPMCGTPAPPASAPPPFLIGCDQADPHLDAIVVDRGPVQQKVILRGSGFADLQCTGYVTLGGHQAPVLFWTSVAIGIVIYPTAYGQSPLALNAAYPVQVVTPASGKKSNTVDFFLTDGPPAVYGP
jgi:parallel beta-helix repeat protein